MEKSVNNKCKAFTSLEQSKKLAEILPLESADMSWYKEIEMFPFELHTLPYSKHFVRSDGGDTLLPCWNLAALLNVINKDFYPNLFHDGEAWNLTATYHDDNTIKYDTCGDDPLDNIYRMIVFLHDQNLI